MHCFSPYFCIVEIFKKYESWNWKRIRRHILYWLLWSMFFVIINTYKTQLASCTEPGVTFWQWVAFESIVLPIKIASAYTIAYLLMPELLYKSKYVSFFIWGVLVILAFAMILFFAYDDIIYPYVLQESADYSVDQFIYKGIELVYITGLVVSIKFFTNYTHEQQVNQTLRQQKVEAELNYLKNQIQPHFLFNTLNNIYGMVLCKDPKAGEAIIKLSDLLSYMLYECNIPEVPLGKEIDMLDSFIELELLRYQRKLDLRYTKSSIPEALKIAPLLLIPFVENAFKHGPAKEEGSSTIAIDIAIEQDILRFTVNNSYQKENALDSLHSGIGLENIRKRLELLYPDRYNLHISEAELYSVDLKITLSKN